jgi:HEAT repeat protein
LLLSWENIDNLEDFFITYLLYKEGKDIIQISKIRNVSIDQVNRDIIKAKENLKKYTKKDKKNIVHKLLEMDKEQRINYISSLEKESLTDLKKKLYKRILQEKNAEDLMILLWIAGEFKDDRFLNIIHSISNHPHGGVRRMAYSAMGKINSSESIDFLHKGLIDSKPQVRQYSAKALMKLGNETSLRKLKNLITNPREKQYVKRAFLEAIKSIEKRMLINK